WPWPMEAAEISLKWADRMAATAEAVHVAGWSEHDTRDTLGLHYPLLEEDPLVDIGLKANAWEPLNSDAAADAWLTALRATAS
ncbi:MAG: phosphohydrolase, partial [Beijerinckiaceae bacterium]|nr:phosphohydrolase [Beijerinckiaceae bacterium]